MNTMAVRAQQTKIASIGVPVAKASDPAPSLPLWPHLPIRVYVVDVENSNIRYSALLTLAAQLLDDREFSKPVRSLLFLASNGVCIVITPLAFLTTKPRGRFATADALPIGAPAGFQIAGTRTIKALGFSVSVYLVCGVAMRANSTYPRYRLRRSSRQPFIPRFATSLRIALALNRAKLPRLPVAPKNDLALLACDVHEDSISRERKYFDIAVKRISDELSRFPLFEPPQPQQKTLLEEA